MTSKKFFASIIFVFIIIALIVCVSENVCGCNTNKIDKKIKKAIRTLDDFTSNAKEHFMGM